MEKYNIILSLAEEFPPGWTEKCIGCMCEASSGCNQTLECMEQNEVKYCGVFLLSDVYWQDAGTPVLQGDDPNRIGGITASYNTLEVLKIVFLLCTCTHISYRQTL